MSALLSVQNLSKSFGGVQAVRGVSFEVAAGSIHSVIGPNGAGKTTLFNMISALVTPTAGQAIFAGADISRTRPHRLARLGIGRTFQNLAVFAHATVVENLLVGMHHAIGGNALADGLFLGPSRRREMQAREEVERIIDFLEIAHLRNEVVGTLSYGL